MSAQASDPRFNLPCSKKNQHSLTDISPIGKTWEKHRNNVDKIVEHYATASEDALNEYAWRLRTCSEWLDFRLVPDASTDTLNFQLTNARFCRVRHCPVCQWRRSLMWKAKAYKILPQVVTDYPKYRWLFITLTVRNCQITELRQTLDEINKGFKRLTELQQFPML